MEELLPAAIGMQMAINQQNVALSVIKKSAEMQQQMANILMDSARSVLASNRGQYVNLAA